jgi:hypothetical protein
MLNPLYRLYRKNENFYVSMYYLASERVPHTGLDSTFCHWFLGLANVGSHRWPFE